MVVRSTLIRTWIRPMTSDGGSGIVFLRVLRCVFRRIFRRFGSLGIRWVGSTGCRCIRCVLRMWGRLRLEFVGLVGAAGRMNRRRDLLGSIRCTTSTDWRRRLLWRLRIGRFFRNGGELCWWVWLLDALVICFGESGGGWGYGGYGVEGLVRDFACSVGWWAFAGYASY